jgi:AAA domain/Toprim-like
MMPRATVVASFVYSDAGRVPLARVDRVEPGSDGRAKEFLPYLADSCGGYSKRSGLNGMKLPIYRSEDISAAIASGSPIWLVEGEGKCDRFRAACREVGRLDAVTTVAGGAGAELTGAHLKQLEGVETIVVVADSDVAGRRAAQKRSQRIADVYTKCDVRNIDLFPDRNDGSDVADWVAEGYTVEDLLALVCAAQSVTPLSTQRNGAATSRSLELTRLDTVKPVQVRWLWRSRIVRGNLNLLVGDPGCGKSFATLAIAQAVTQGIALPDGEAQPPARVLIWNAEDAVADTIRPRAERLGADLTRLHVIEGEIDQEGHHIGFGMGSIDLLVEKVAELGDVGLVIIDPIAALLAGIDAHRDADVRSTLQPLVEFARGSGVAVLAVMHLRKSDAERALYRVGGSIGFVGLARSVLLAAVDPEDGRRAIAPLKCNLAAAPASVEYRIDAEGAFWWGQTTNDLNAEYLLRSVHESRGGSRRQAEDFLREMLCAGPVASVEIEAARQERAISERTFKRARKNLQIVTEKFKAGWTMRLP